jgi:hypothetical protein
MARAMLAGMPNREEVAGAASDQAHATCKNCRDAKTLTDY